MKRFKIEELKQFGIYSCFPLDAEFIDLTGYAELIFAKFNELSFVNIDLVSRHKYFDNLKNSNSNFVVIEEKYCTEDLKKLNKIFLFSKNPRLSFFKIAENLLSLKSNNDIFKSYNRSLCKGCVDELVQIEEGVTISEFSKIEKYVKIDSGTYIGCNVHVKEGVKIGKNCKIHSNVVLECCEIGDGVEIFCGAVIGKSGFGFEFNHEIGKFETIPHIGKVKIGNGCKIGANTCIDRGSMRDTVLGDNVMIDNLVQIAHNVSVGSFTCIAGQSGIAGSTVIGKNCLIGGQVAIAGHITIEDDVTIMGGASIYKNVSSKQIMSSAFPASDRKTWNRFVAKLRRLTDTNE